MNAPFAYKFLLQLGLLWSVVCCGIPGSVYNACAQAGSAQSASSGILQAMGTPAQPRVVIPWNRYHNTDALAGYLLQMAQTWPALVKRTVIGKSHEGKDLWCLTITDFSVGTPEEKPAYYVDGNIHSNEVQASEVVLYLAWYLTEMHGQSAYIRQLLREKTFYLVPTTNPDGRDHFISRANNTHSPRTGLQPRDDDRDGKVDEDGSDDLNGDGHITLMRRKSPTGRFYPDPANPRRMLQAPADQFGGWEILGYEGVDNDGDGSVNEDGPGYIDPNRDWPWIWQPRMIQGGADKYPLSLPENRAVADFIRAHPNISGAMSFHNTGGMLLRGPGNKEDAPAYNAQDVAVYDALGKLGESLMPGYRYINTYEDLYQVYGGQTDWMWGAQGIYSFTGELYNSFVWFGRTLPGGWFTDEESQHIFDKYLLLNEAFVDWTPYKHPQYGDIEVGGFKKQFMRINPGFQLEEECHRNTAFMLYHAWNTPRLQVQAVQSKDLGGGLTELTVTILNDRLTPTRSAHEIHHRMTAPDVVTLTGNGQVLSGLVITNPDLGLVSIPESPEADRLLVSAVPGMGKVTLRWIVRGKGPWTLEYRSRKGGVLRTELK
ncbi:MAG: peptidase M14 [Bacteroidetes bacterium]|nr:peptidase M14 [Bacteroidota bacterium]